MRMWDGDPSPTVWRHWRDQLDQLATGASDPAPLTAWPRRVAPLSERLVTRSLLLWVATTVVVMAASTTAPNRDAAVRDLTVTGSDAPVEVVDDGPADALDPRDRITSTIAPAERSIVTLLRRLSSAGAEAPLPTRDVTRPVPAPPPAGSRSST